MISKKNKYVKRFLSLLILASCSSTPINLITSSDQSYSKVFKRDLQDIRAYNAFFKSDLEIMQGIIDDQKISQSELRDLKLLKKNYQKILKKNKYQIELNPNQKYSEKLKNVRNNREYNSIVKEEEERSDIRFFFFHFFCNLHFIKVIKDFLIKKFSFNKPFLD